MAETFEFYCGGEFRKSGESLVIRNPFDQSDAGETFLAGVPDLEHAIQWAGEALELLGKIPSFERYRVLCFIRDELRVQKEAFARLITLESAKPLRYSLAEVERSIQCFTIAAEETKRLPMEYISIDWTPPGKNKEGLVRYFPVGIVAGISPFNFPLNLAVHKLAPAIAAGCPIILKPSSATPLAALMLAKIIDKAGLPPGAISIMPMNRTNGNLLVTDPRISMLSFTGSPAVGWKMKQNAGRKKVVLELGGNAGVIISGSKDLESVVNKCVGGGFSYSGQVCIHTQRIFVRNEIFYSFIELFVNKVKQLKQGSPLDLQTDISVMIDQENALRVEQWVEEAVNGGAHLWCGGKRKDSYFEPTVISSTQGNMKVSCEEVFGPVVIVEKFDTFGQAVEMINDSRFGLQAGVFTDSIEEMNDAFENIRAGGVMINEVPNFRVDHMPYGGTKDSGFGREGIKYAIAEMLESKILVKDK